MLVSMEINESYGVVAVRGDVMARTALVVTTAPTADTKLLDAVGGPGTLGVKVVGGMMAGTLLNHDLILEETAAAVAPHRKAVT